MTSICPESTVESANRRNFIKKAALATAAVGVGGNMIGRSSFPESMAESATTDVVHTNTPCRNVKGNLAIFNGSADITGNLSCGTACLTGSPPCGPVLCVTNSFCCYKAVGLRATAGTDGGCNGTIGLQGIGGTGVCGTSFVQAACCPGAFGGIGVRGIATSTCLLCCGIGVLGSAQNGIGVCASSHTGVGLHASSVSNFALSGSSCFPTIARLTNSGGAKNKSAIVQFQNGCCKPSSWYTGIGGAGNSHCITDGQFYFLGSCEPRMILNKCGKVGIGTITPGTTLDVNGSISAKAANVTAKTYPVATTDFSIFANAVSNDISIDLPLASVATGRVLFIKRIDKTSNTVAVTGSSTNTVEGKTSISLSSQYSSLTLISNGSEWFILSNAT